MDILKAKFGMVVVVGLIGAAFGSGGHAAVVRSDVSRHETEIQTLQQQKQEDRERLIRIETIVERIEKKVDP